MTDAIFIAVNANLSLLPVGWKILSGFLDFLYLLPVG